MNLASQRIIALEAENIKKLKAVRIDAGGKDMVVVGGRNAQGKSSLLDSIFMAIGGKAAADAKPVREGAKRGKISVTTNDLVIERIFIEGGGTTLTVKSSEGAKFSSPQAILDKMTSAVAFDPLAFSRLEARKQAETLRKLVGLDFSAHDAERKRLYDERTLVNRDAAKLTTVRDAIPIDLANYEYDPAAIDKLTAEIADASNTNAANARARAEKYYLERDANNARNECRRLREALEKAEKKTKDLENILAELEPVPADVDVAGLQARLASLKEAKEAHERVEEHRRLSNELRDALDAANALTRQIDQIDADKRDALAAADMPVPGLSFDEGEVIYQGIPFDQLAASEKIHISAAIACALNPTLRVMIIKDGSLLDDDAMAILADIAGKKNVQIWIERVGSDKHTSVVIEDGSVVVAEEEKMEVANA